MEIATNPFQHEDTMQRPAKLPAAPYDEDLLHSYRPDVSRTEQLVEFLVPRDAVVLTYGGPFNAKGQNPVH